MPPSKRLPAPYASRTPERPASRSEGGFPLMCGLAVTTIVTLGLDYSPMTSTLVGVCAGACAMFFTALAMRIKG